jgi:hypothetical protein
VGMQQWRHALQQGEQRNQDRMADFHRWIIEGESFTPLTWRKLRYDARTTRPCRSAARKAQAPRAPLAMNPPSTGMVVPLM